MGDILFLIFCVKVLFLIVIFLGGGGCYILSFKYEKIIFR